MKATLYEYKCVFITIALEREVSLLYYIARSLDQQKSNDSFLGFIQMKQNFFYDLNLPESPDLWHVFSAKRQRNLSPPSLFPISTK